MSHVVIWAPVRVGPHRGIGPPVHYATHVDPCAKGRELIVEVGKVDLRSRRDGREARLRYDSGGSRL